MPVSYGQLSFYHHFTCFNIHGDDTELLLVGKMLRSRHLSVYFRLLAAQNVTFSEQVDFHLRFSYKTYIIDN